VLDLKPIERSSVTQYPDAEHKNCRYCILASIIRNPKADKDGVQEDQSRVA
jgi:hypothetical protein